MRVQPDGVFVFNEYVGATYNVYPHKQLNIINRLLRAIAPSCAKTTNSNKPPWSSRFGTTLQNRCARH